MINLGCLGWALHRRRFFSPFQPSLSFRLVPGNVVIVAIGMCVKSPNAGEWIYGITWRHVYFNIPVLFNEDTTSILKLVFTTVYCFCLDGYVGGYAFAIINTIVVVFIYLLIYLFICLFVCLFIYLFVIFLLLRLFFLFLSTLLSSPLLLLLLESSLPRVCVWLLLMLI